MKGDAGVTSQLEGQLKKRKKDGVKEIKREYLINTEQREGEES